ncbi:MAG TPA: substrate-binding domain-containing protein [Spirochaetota bacterium]|nr:substrate-binding domain-containing protein [Spirochaetota bacterium]
MAITIGLIIDQQVYEYQAELWHGVCQQAGESGVNVVSYVGGTIDNKDQTIINMNRIFEFISKKRIDGAIVLVSSVASRINTAEKNAFMKKIAACCPVVSVGDVFREYPSIAVDNRKGMYDSVCHLITAHGKKRIAFIGGPPSSVEATERFNAYKDALKDNGIPYDEKLYYPGNFVYDAGIEAVKTFASLPGKFDAVVAASDWMAFGALQELRQRGYDIPGQIAVSGFDNVVSTEISKPPLSSVKQPIFDMGRKSVLTMLALIEKSGYEMLTVFPTEHIIRDSCGCLFAERKTAEGSSDQKEDSSDSEKHNELKDVLIEKLKGDMSQSGSIEFLRHLNYILQQVSRLDEIPEFNHMISDVRAALLSPESLSARNDSPLIEIRKHRSHKRDDVEKMMHSQCEYVYKLEDNLHKAFSLVTRRAEQLQFVKYLDTNNMSSQIIQIGQHLLTAYDRDHLFAVIRNEFPSIDIQSCALLEYTEPDPKVLSKQSRVLFGYDNERTMKTVDAPFDTDLIVPDEYWPSDSTSPWLVNVIPVNYQQEPIGYMFYKSNNQFGLVFESFSSEIASALKGIENFEKHVTISASIEERSRKINELVVPMISSIQLVANQSGSEVETIKGLADITSNGLTKLRDSNDIIGQASQSINQMLDMINMIQDLSENINILALNASIESARAGSYGLGFQVIASEVKHLSDSTAQNTKSITEILNKVVSSIDKSSAASRDNFKVFSNVKDHVLQLTNLLINVTNKMNELSAASNEILTEIERKI